MKTTMADAHEHLDAVDDSDGDQYVPVMPHLSYSEHELDQKHPKIQAPDDLQMDDPTDDARDAVYQKGLEIAQEIQKRAAKEGRRRHPSVQTVTRKVL